MSVVISILDVATLLHPPLLLIVIATFAIINSTTIKPIPKCHEIYNLQINSDLVVLSSCESGLGELLTGEGMMGLNRSFVYAGVPNVIFSLWKVLDQVGSEMMIEFYKEVLSGKSYSAALRATKLKMLANEATASPEFWSAFLLIGR